MLTISKAALFLPLGLALVSGSQDVSRHIPENALIDEKVDTDGNTALIRAASAGNTAMVENLLRSGGTEVNQANNRGATALIAAVRKCNAEIVSILIEKGANVNLVDLPDKRSALSEVFRCRSLPLVFLLLDGGADINTATAQGDTPLMRAVDSGFHDGVIALIVYGADVNKKTLKGSALSMASGDYYEKGSQIRKTLILAGAKEDLTASNREPDISDPFSSTHSDMARINIAFLVLKKKNNEKVLLQDESFLDLFWTFSAVRLGLISQIMRYLVSLGCEYFVFLQVFSQIFASAERKDLTRLETILSFLASPVLLPQATLDDETKIMQLNKKTFQMFVLALHARGLGATIESAQNDLRKLTRDSRASGIYSEFAESLKKNTLKTFVGGKLILDVFRKTSN